MKPRGICRGQSFNNNNNRDRPYSPDNNEEDCRGMTVACLMGPKLMSNVVYVYFYLASFSVRGGGEVNIIS